MVRDLERTDARAAGLWFAATLVLYLITAARGLVWADSSKLTLYALSTYLPTLNPGDHAGWTLIATAWLRLAGGDPVVTAHRLSALAGACTAGLLFLALRGRGADRGRAHTAVAIAVVALPVWWAATVAETYLPALALTLGGSLALHAGDRWWRWLPAGVAWGLALACHAMTLFLIVPLLWEAEGSRSWRVAPGVAVGAAPMWLAMLGSPPDPLTGFAAGSGAAWRWHWEAFIALARMPKGLAVIAALLLYGVGVLGAAAFWRGRSDEHGGRAWAASLSVLTILLAVYAPYRLHVMTALLVVGLLLALPVRLSGTARLAHIVSQGVLYLALPSALTISGRQDLGVRVLPDRNNAFYFLCPIKNAVWGRGLWEPATLFDPGADRYVDELGRCAPQHAVVLADFNAGAPLRLAQRVRRWRRDLDVHAAAVDVAMGSPDPAKALEGEIARALVSRAVVLADTYPPYYHLDVLETRFAVSPCRAGAVVAPRSGGGGP